MIANDFIRTDSQGERYLDNRAFRGYIREVDAARAQRKPEDDKKALAKFNKALSSIAGVAELNSIEGDFEVLNIYRDSLPLDFAQVRPLPLGSLPLYRSRYINPVNLTIGSTAGMGSTVYYATKDYGTQVFPFTYSTERVMVPNLNNLYDMEKLQQRRDGTARLDEYLQIGLHNICVNTVFSNPSSVSVVTDDPATSITNYFANGGSFSGQNVYVLDPGVQATAVPSVNIYDLSSSEAGLTKRVFQVVNTHSIQIQRNFSKMYIPTAATTGHSPVWESLQNMATPVALVTSGLTVANSYDPAKAIPSDMWSEFQKENFRGSIVVNWFGLNVEISKQNWLPPGYIVLFSDQPSMILWDRLNLESGQPKEGSLETPVDGFYSYISKAKNIATARPSFCLRNFLTIKVNA